MLYLQLNLKFVYSTKLLKVTKLSLEIRLVIFSLKQKVDYGKIDNLAVFSFLALS